MTEHTLHKSERGFTLVELAIVFLIFGLTVLFVSRFISLYTLNARYEKTAETIETTSSALGEFFGLNGRYPCPADPTLGPGDILYGVEQCRTVANLVANPNDCTGTPGNIACTTVGSRDGDLNGANDPVMIGVVPFRTIIDGILYTDYTEANAFDGFNLQLTYAVTEPMADTRLGITNPANPNSGAITVWDENRISLTDPPGAAHYTVISHGDNGRGGYSRSGVQSEDCLLTTLPGFMGTPTATPPGPSPAGIEIEIENCDNNDAIFAKAIRSSGDNQFFNDDTSSFTTRGLTSLWRRDLSSPPGEAYIYNTNTGNVGVGREDPSFQLHIMGDLSAETQIVGLRYCQGNNDTECLDINDIGGNGSQCPPGQAAYAIGHDPAVSPKLGNSTRLHCRPANWDFSRGLTCPPYDFAVFSQTGATAVQTYLNGFSNLGNIVCCSDSNQCITVTGPNDADISVIP